MGFPCVRIYNSTSSPEHWRTGTFGLWGKGEGRSPSCQENTKKCPNPWGSKSGYKRTQTAWKTKTFTILTTNKTVTIQKIVILKPHILYDSESFQKNSTISLWSCPKRLFSEPPQKENFGLRSLWFFYHLCWWKIGNVNNIHIVDFHDTHLLICGFSKAEDLKPSYHLNLTFCQGKRQTKYPTSCCPSHERVTRKISQFQKPLACTPLPTPSQYAHVPEPIHRSKMR